MVDKWLIQKMDDLNPKDISHMVNESLNEGHRHILRLSDEYENGINRFDKQGEAFFAAKFNGQLVGVCGLNQDPYSMNGLGRVRRMYVSIDYRRQGIAKLLMDQVIEEAKKHYQMIVLKTDNPAAERFYLSLGFLTESRNEKVSHYLILR
ncbi:MAG: family N-acetyltransferase [Paenibacillus sp.]|jgi:ribosomal protein S18 acetylase RimI-like enzyme|nr:family N-acetyltransferase [Paenibacillus sp.]